MATEFRATSKNLWLASAENEHGDARTAVRVLAETELEAKEKAQRFLDDEEDLFAVTGVLLEGKIDVF